MRKQFVTHISFILLAGLIGSCGSQSSKSEDSDKPDVVSEETVTFTGQLNVSIGLLAAKRQILYFSLVGGQVMQAPTEVKVDEEGNFSTEVNRKNDVAMAAKKALEQTTIDREPLKKAFPQYANDIDGMTEEELRQGLKEMVDQLAAQGGPQYILVSYVPGGSALDEARSFQFIGLPTSGSNDVIVIPGESVKGNLDLGQIGAGSGDKTLSERKADSDVFDLDDNAINQLATVGQTLKTVKNYWANRNPKASDGVTSRAEPFFMWTTTFANLQAGATPAQFDYSGWGTYVKVENDSLNFDAFCPSSGTPTQSITFVPPADVIWGQKDNSGQISNPKTLNAATPFDNGQPSRMSQNGKSVCNGSATGFYARQDEANQYMLNWGTGGSIQGEIPKGFWQLKLDSSNIGNHDLSAGYPIDANGKTKVYVPKVNVTKSGDNLATVNVQWYIYNTASASYEALTSLELFKKLGSDIAISVSIGNGNGADERRAVVGRSDGNDFSIDWSGNNLVATMPAEYQRPLSSQWGQSGKITSIMIQYKIGSTTYNFSFR